MLVAEVGASNISPRLAWGSVQVVSSLEIDWQSYSCNEGQIRLFDQVHDTLDYAKNVAIHQGGSTVELNSPDLRHAEQRQREAQRADTETQRADAEAQAWREAEERAAAETEFARQSSLFFR